MIKETLLVEASNLLKSNNKFGQTAMKEIPLYQSHKKVRALEIDNLEIFIDEGTAKLEFIDKDYAPITISLAMITRYKPVSGDFYVVYEDSYESFSPRKAFLEGYTKCSF